MVKEGGFQRGKGGKAKSAYRGGEGGSLSG